jgi:hypothetical protein
MVTVFEHRADTPFSVVVKLSVKLPGLAAALILTVGPVLGPTIPAVPVTLQK